MSKAYRYRPSCCRCSRRRRRLRTRLAAATTTSCALPRRRRKPKPSTTRSKPRARTRGASASSWRVRKSSAGAMASLICPSYAAIGTSEFKALRQKLEILRDPIHLVAFGFGSGLAPRAPGTAGSALALVFVWLQLDLPFAGQIAVAAVAIVVGIYVCGESARRLGAHDHPGIVFDEIAGML